MSVNVLVSGWGGTRIVEFTRVPCVGEHVAAAGLAVVVYVCHVDVAEYKASVHVERTKKREWP